MIILVSHHFADYVPKRNKGSGDDIGLSQNHLVHSVPETNIAKRRVE